MDSAVKWASRYELRDLGRSTVRSPPRKLALPLFACCVAGLLVSRSTFVSLDCRLCSPLPLTPHFGSRASSLSSLPLALHSIPSSR